MRERIIGVAIMRGAANERYGARDPIAFAAPVYGLFGRRGAEIIDPQVERRVRPKTAQLDPHRQAGRHVHHREDRAGGEHTAFGIADQPGIIRQLQFGPVGPVIMIFDAEQPGMAALAGTHEQARIEGEGRR